jgi:hypothetical protein
VNNSNTDLALSVVSVGMEMGQVVTLSSYHDVVMNVLSSPSAASSPYSCPLSAPPISTQVSTSREDASRAHWQRIPAELELVTSCHAPKSQLSRRSWLA